LTSFDALMTIAEMAVGLAGFSAVVGTFARQGKLSFGDRYSFTWLFVTAFVAAVLAFAPILIADTGREGPDLWRSASVTMIAVWILQIGRWVLGLRQLRQQAETVSLGLAHGPLLTVPSAFNLVLQILNATGVAWEPTAAPYIIGTLIWLYAASLIFVGLVLERPEE